MKHFYLLLLFLTATQLHAADTVRVCTWNLLNYSETNEDGRTVMYKKVLDEIQPDVIILQEVVDAKSAFQFATTVPDLGWQFWGFNDGPDTDNFICYNPSKVQGGERIIHPTGLRDITEYQLLLGSTQDTLYVFSLHLKAGDTDEDETARANELEVLRSRLLEIYSRDDRAKIIVAGDFNFYSMQEEGYKMMTSQEFWLIDPLAGWVRNDPVYAHVYTQATRTDPDGACGGGVGGGIDDRFDIIFCSTSLGQESYLPESYTAFGNDGQARLNNAINNPPNTKVSADIADALRCASDHLPVYADFVFNTTTSVPEEFTSAGFRIYPMPVTDESVIELLSPADRISIVDVLGREVYSVAVDGRSRVPLPKLVPGVYSCRVSGASTLFIAK